MRWQQVSVTVDWSPPAVSSRQMMHSESRPSPASASALRLRRCRPPPPALPGDEPAFEPAWRGLEDERPESNEEASEVVSASFS